MKILFVVNNYYIKGNGLGASARRSVKLLKEAGHDVRVLSAKNPYKGGPEPEFCLDDVKICFFNKLVVAQGYSFAKINRKTIRRAVEWADVVHIEEPFFIQRVTLHWVRKLGVPCTATYHLHPENMFASINMENCRFINEMMLRFWRRRVFDHCSDIQCPTANVRERLERAGFKACLHEISNGIEPEEGFHIFHGDDEPFRICCIWRLSREKDQFTLLEAMRYSKYASRIQLHFAGRGPMKKEYEEMAEKLYEEGVLKYMPVFTFEDRDGLRKIARTSDLYVHCATIEVEGLSCLEALQQGVVPVIAEGRLTATPQFALDERSLFPMRNPKALAEKIDYWVEHPEERKTMSSEYIRSTGQYDINKSIAALINMFETAINRKNSASVGIIR